MKGLIYKDILTLRSYSKTLIMMMVIFIGISVVNKDFLSFLTFWLPFFSVMMCISTFSYDEYNKWDGYALTLPLDRKEIVKSKYVLFLSFLAISTFISVCVVIIISLIQTGGVDFAQIGFSLVGVLAATFLLGSILLPLMYKFGAEKGRLYLFIVLAIVALLVIGVFTLLEHLMSKEAIEQLGMFLGSYGWIFALVILLGIFYGSYCLSKHFFLKKEF